MAFQGAPLQPPSWRLPQKRRNHIGIGVQWSLWEFCTIRLAEAGSPGESSTKGSREHPPMKQPGFMSPGSAFETSAWGRDGCQAKWKKAPSNVCIPPQIVAPQAIGSFRPTENTETNTASTSWIVFLQPISNAGPVFQFRARQESCTVLLYACP